jgi:predicted site-specific integrase-resolvase
MADKFTTREVAELLGVETSRIQRLFSDGTLPDCGRFAGKRTVPGTMVPQIVDALRARGWLPEAEAVR